MKNKTNLIWIIFFGIGLTFLCISLVLNNQISNIKKNGIEKKAIITDIDNNDKVYVSYEVNGISYEGVLNYYSSNMRKGDLITIYYDKNDPNHIETPEIEIILYIFLGIGSLFFIIGLIFILYVLFKSKKNKELRETGMLIKANIDSVTIDYTFRVNRQHPYIINCSYLLNGKVYLFKSDHIWYDASAIINNLDIKTIPVYVKGDDYTKYYVDTQSLNNYLGNKI